MLLLISATPAKISAKSSCGPLVVSGVPTWSSTTIMIKMGGSFQRNMSETDGMIVDTPSYWSQKPWSPKHLGFILQIEPQQNNRSFAVKT